MVERQRGIHEINNEMVFPTNPGFIFHDSRGFEGGQEDELVKVQEFINQRSQEIKLNNQLHAIWYFTLRHWQDPEPV